MSPKTAKKIKKNIRTRNWTSAEVTLFTLFTIAKGVVSEYTPLDTSLEKLRRKYTTLKAEWRKISDRCKNGSGLVAEKEPSSYKIFFI